MTVNAVMQRTGPVSMVLLVKSVKQHRTKNGEMMAFAAAMDETGSLDLAFMPNTYRKYVNILKKGIIVFIRGEKDFRSSVKVNEIVLLKG